MTVPRPRFGLGTVSLAVGLVYLLAGAMLVAAVRQTMHAAALASAATEARLLLNRNLATHAYFAHSLKPAVFELSDPFRPPDYFDPRWMSSTYAIREIDREFQGLQEPQYYYKECAINARSPENEADSYERDFLIALSQDPELTEERTIRTIGGETFFVFLKRGETMEEGCLRCHDTAARAPAGLVARYGSSRSFGRSVGEVVSAVSIRIPLDAAFARGNAFAWRLSGGLLVLLGGLFGLQRAILRAWVTRPVQLLHAQAKGIAADEARLGEEVPLPRGLELFELAAAFNTMSRSLRRTLDGLEDTVARRTGELERANVRLREEIRGREAIQAQREEAISELSAALDEIRTLRGIIPICAVCKKIRDDQGLWQQVEAYFQRHTLAEFSHGICPDCMARLYPEVLVDSHDP
ncbi:MAG: methyl-accepting chemotaxis protein [Thermodesulfobacteriota bacterium]